MLGVSLACEDEAGQLLADLLHEDEIVKFSEMKTIPYLHSDREIYEVDWYRLADFQGWVHDFCVDDPPGRSIKFLVCH